MKLNMYTLEHELRCALNPTGVTGSLSSDYRFANLEYPLLLESLEDYTDTIVYVTSEGQLAEELIEHESGMIAPRLNRPFHCICVGKPAEPFLKNKWCDIIWVESNIKRSKLLNIIQTLFHRFHTWEWNLEQIVSDYGTVADIVVASLDIFKNDIWLSDQFNRIIVHRVYKNIRLTQDQLDEIRDNDFLPKSMTDDGNEEELGGRDFGDSEPVFFRMQAHNCITLSCAIHAFNNYRLTLSIEPNFQDVGEKDYILIRTLAHYLELAYSKIDTSLESERGSDPRLILLSMLQDKHIPGFDFAHAMLTISWDLSNHHYLCLCCSYSFERRIYDSCFIRSHMSTCNRIQQIYDCLAIPYNGRIVIVVNLTKNGFTEDEFIDDFSKIARSYRLTAGVSALFSRLQEIPGRYLQAMTALEHHESLDDNEVIVRFEDHLIEFAIDSIVSDIPPEFFCPKELISLIKYDKNHNADLYKTLKVYIENNCSATAACKKLFIVRSSFIYRLRKIEKMLGFNPNDNDKRFLLSLSFAIIEKYGFENFRS